LPNGNRLHGFACGEKAVRLMIDMVE
jgi:hypothetical protein